MAARSVPERPDASEATSRISGTPNMYHRPIEYANCAIAPAGHEAMKNGREHNGRTREPSSGNHTVCLPEMSVCSHIYKHEGPHVSAEHGQVR